MEQPALRLWHRDRLVALAGVAGLAALSWALFLRQANMSPSDSMPGMAMPVVMPLPWLAAMWVIMMTAMMLPATAPIVLLFQDVQRRREPADRTPGATPLLLLGYLLIWAGFALVAATGQWLLHRETLLTPGMRAASPLAAGGLLVVAGVYQWLPAKRFCLAHCRSPFGFLTSHWRDGRVGALRMGLTHGAYCVGCCWLLMATLFAVGVMNLLYVAALSALVLAERVLPGGAAAARVGGGILVVWGAWLILQAV